MTAGASEMVAGTLLRFKLQFSVYSTTFETSIVEVARSSATGGLLIGVLYSSLFLLEADFHIFDKQTRTRRQNIERAKVIKR